MKKNTAVRHGFDNAPSLRLVLDQWEEREIVEVTGALQTRTDSANAWSTFGLNVCTLAGGLAIVAGPYVVAALANAHPIFGM